MGKLEEFKEQRAVLHKRMVELDNSIETLENAKWLFEEGENIWFVDQFGSIQCGRWGNKAWSEVAFTQGHIFKTDKGAILESERRNLLQRFKLFRDKCNDGWKPDWKNENSCKYCLLFEANEFSAVRFYLDNMFNQFGYFKNKNDALKAIELYGDEIKALFVDCEG